MKYDVIAHAPGRWMVLVEDSRIPGMQEVVVVDRHRTVSPVLKAGTVAAAVPYFRDGPGDAPEWVQEVARRALARTQ